MEITLPSYIYHLIRTTKTMHPMHFIQIPTTASYYKYSYFPLAVVQWNHFTSQAAVCPGLGSTRRFVVCLFMCHFVLLLLSPFRIAITSLGEEKANLSAFRTFVRFVLVWICRFPLPLGVWEWLRFVIVALPGLFSYLFFSFRSYAISLQCH